MNDIEQKLIELLDNIKRLVTILDTEDQKLFLARIYGNLCWMNNIKLFEDGYWEKLFVNDLYDKYSKIISIDKQVKDELHIITECYSHGGHTRLLENILKIRGKGDVLISHMEPNYETKLFVKDRCSVYNFPSKEGSIEDIITIAQSYKTIYLHINPDDIISSVAVGILKKKLRNNIKIVFVNHADHVFSFGFECADLIAEIGLNGYSINKNYRKNKGLKSFFLGIPIDFRHLVEDRIGLNKQTKFTIISCGADYKYKSFKDYNFPNFIEKLISANIDFELIILGVDKSKSYWKSLHKYENIKLLESVSFPEYQKIISKAHLCLDSWPYFGGTALPNAWMKGLCVTGLYIPIIGVSPIQQVWFRSDEELLKEIQSFYRDYKQSKIYKLNISNKLKEEFIINHGFENIGVRLDNALKSDNVTFEYFTDYDLSENDSLFFYKIWKAESKINFAEAHKDWLVNYLFNKNKNLTMSNKNLENELNRIYHSWNWKIMMPVRVFLNIYRKAFKIKNKQQKDEKD